ncbi:MAG: hypothetical protein KDD25_10490, partial [Bdellovibrionales bacterium]|nr:hypothetical protein [Bdellovibrionales bacterium]
GFWFAHCGWYIQSKNPWICFLYAIAGPIRTLFDGYHRPRSNQEHNHLAKDISNDAFFSWVSRPNVYFFACWIHVGVMIGAAVFFFGIRGIPFVWFCSVFVYNLGDSVDSLGHLLGKRNFPSASMATDSLLMAIVTFGDGWHSAHHRYPSSARHGLLKGQWDWTFFQLQLFKKLGLVTRLNQVPVEIVNRDLASELKSDRKFASIS